VGLLVEEKVNFN